MAAVADAQRQQITLPVKIRACQLHRRGLQLTEARQPGEQVGRCAQHFFEVLGGVCRDLTAKPARGHVQKHLVANLAQVDWPCRHIQQRQCLSRLQGHPGSLGEIIGGAQRQQCQAGLRMRLPHGFGHIAQSTVAASCHHMGVASRQRLGNQPLRITRFPGHPHIQRPAPLTLGEDGLAHIFVHRLLAVQDHHCLTHHASPKGPLIADLDHRRGQIAACTS
ncbi:hypothetical protein D3C73_1082480 [compost metagenome]